MLGLVNRGRVISRLLVECLGGGNSDCTTALFLWQVGLLSLSVAICRWLGGICFTCALALVVAAHSRGSFVVGLLLRAVGLLPMIRGQPWLGQPVTEMLQVGKINGVLGMWRFQGNCPPPLRQEAVQWRLGSQCGTLL